MVELIPQDYKASVCAEGRAALRQPSKRRQSISSADQSNVGIGRINTPHLNCRESSEFNPSGWIEPIPYRVVDCQLTLLLIVFAGAEKCTQEIPRDSFASVFLQWFIGSLQSELIVQFNRYTHNCQSLTRYVYITAHNWFKLRHKRWVHSVYSNHCWHQLIIH